MQLLNPRTYRPEHPDAHTNEMLQAVVDWFETRGLKRLKQDFHDRTWNYDFVDFMKSRQVLATLMTPEGYGDDAAWNTLRNVEFAEIAAFYGITYWYTFQVSMLGLGPIFTPNLGMILQFAFQRTALFKRSSKLKIFQFKINIRAAEFRQRSRMCQWRIFDFTLDTHGCLFYIVEGDRHNYRLNRARSFQQSVQTSVHAF